MKNGYWNGESTAVFSAIEYQPLQVENINHWQNRYVGKTRQAIKITYEGETWLIDNEHGDGYYKVTKGMGSPGCGHKSISKYLFIKDLDDSEIKVEYDYLALKKETAEQDEFIKINSPEDHKKLIALREMLMKRK